MPIKAPRSEKMKVERVISATIISCCCIEYCKLKPIPTINASILVATERVIRMESLVKSYKHSFIL